MMTNEDRIFVGVYPGGIVYADRAREVGGDYKRLAFLSFNTLELRIEADCPKKLVRYIANDASTIQARKGEQYEISTCGQTVTLGGPECNDRR